VAGTGKMDDTKIHETQMAGTKIEWLAQKLNG
jgi:hypothetical protein